MKNIFVYIIISGLLMLSSCVSTSLVPRPRDADHFIYGSYVVIHHKDAFERYSGELLAVTRDSILYLNTGSSFFQDKKVQALAIKDIHSMKVKVAAIANSPGGIIVWASLLIPLSFSHGYIGIITLPVNLINFIIMSATVGGTYQFTIPRDQGWEDAGRYARFPQGWPEGLARNSIK